MTFSVPLGELRVIHSQSGGPGGQNVNKRMTQVTIKWSFRDSGSLSQDQKEIVALKLKNRINKEGKIVVTYSQTRSQKQNYALAVAILNKLINEALKKPKKRTATKVPRRAIEKRIKEKRLKSEKKKGRGKVGGWDDF